MVSVRCRTHDVITTVGSVWDSQHGNQSGTTKSDVQTGPSVRGRWQHRCSKCDHHFYPILSSKRDWHEDISVLVRVVMRGSIKKLVEPVLES